MPVSAPADKRFRRARVSPTRQKAWLPRPSWKLALHGALVVSATLFVLYKTVAMVASADALTISTIAVNGNLRMSRGEVLSLLDGLNGQNMLTVNLEDWRQQLLNSPWVADATIRRRLPATVAVTIVERQPLALARLGSDLHLVDHQGRLIDEYSPNYAEFDLPIIDGLASRRRNDDSPVDDVRAALAVSVMAALRTRPDLAARVSQIDVSDPRDAVLLLKGDTTLVRIGVEQFVERLESYLDLVPALRERIPNIDYVDLRFGERVYVKPQGSLRAVATAARDKGE